MPYSPVSAAATMPSALDRQHSRCSMDVYCGQERDAGRHARERPSQGPAVTGVWGLLHGCLACKEVVHTPWAVTHQPWVTHLPQHGQDLEGGDGQVVGEEEHRVVCEVEVLPAALRPGQVRVPAVDALMACRTTRPPSTQYREKIVGGR